MRIITFKRDVMAEGIGVKAGTIGFWFEDQQVIVFRRSDVTGLQATDAAAVKDRILNTVGPDFYTVEDALDPNGMTETIDLEGEEWREYTWVDPITERTITMHVVDPKELSYQPGGWIHHVIDKNGVHFMFPGIGYFGCAVSAKPRTPTQGYSGTSGTSGVGTSGTSGSGVSGKSGVSGGSGTSGATPAK